MRHKTFKPDEQGVSETIGFIIILGIVMTGIALVTLYGYPALLNQQAEANIKNMENTMIVLQTDLNSLAYKNVPYQETAIQVSGGVLSVQNPDAGYLKSLNITNGTPGNEVVISAFKPGEIRYTADQQNVIIVSSEWGGTKVADWTHNWRIHGNFRTKVVLRLLNKNSSSFTHPTANTSGEDANTNRHRGCKHEAGRFACRYYSIILTSTNDHHQI